MKKDMLTKLKIRSMKNQDISQVLSIEKDAFPNLFPSTNFRTEIYRKISNCFIAEIPEDFLLNTSTFPYRNGYTGQEKGDSFIIGYSVTWEIADETHIISIGVRRRYLRRGIGEKIISKIISNSINKSSQSITLEVRPSNNAAIKLYEKFDFKVVGKRHRYYSDNLEDALIMTLNIQNKK